MAVRDAANMLESLEAVGDDLFQAAVFRDLVYLLVRTFPDFCGYKSDTT